jgi:ATP-dependent DNA ligase
VKALASLPDETVIDGEVVALNESGKPSFNTLQNYGSSAAPAFYFVFDVLVLAGRDVTDEPLIVRRALLQRSILPKLGDPIRHAPELRASVSDLIHSVKAQGLEGLVAKLRNSRYEPGLRTGAWQKMRVNQGQEFVIAGYTPGDKNFDALVVGHYEKGKLLYAARTRSGFTPASRVELFKHFRGLHSEPSDDVSGHAAHSGNRHAEARNVEGRAWRSGMRASRRPAICT